MNDFERDSDDIQRHQKTFVFTDNKNDETLRVVIPEVIDPAYGMYIWPCAPVLAQYIWFHKDYVTGKKVLELGSGTSLPGVVAGKCGAVVTLSDSALYPRCLENCKLSCQVNDMHNIDIIPLSWGHFTPELLTIKPIDIILGSDCFYDKKDFEDIIVTVSFIMEKNRNCEFWCSYQERSSDWSIGHLLEKWMLTCDQVELSSFDGEGPSLAGSDLPGHHTIHMLVMKKEESVK